LKQKNLKPLEPYSGQIFGKTLSERKESHSLYINTFIKRKTHGENKVFDVLDIPCKDEWEQEVNNSIYSFFSC
jgi:hypothetical protein